MSRTFNFKPRLFIDVTSALFFLLRLRVSTSWSSGLFAEEPEVTSSGERGSTLGQGASLSWNLSGSSNQIEVQLAHVSGQFGAGELGFIEILEARVANGVGAFGTRLTVDSRRCTRHFRSDSELHRSWLHGEESPCAELQSLGKNTCKNHFHRKLFVTTMRLAPNMR